MQTLFYLLQAPSKEKVGDFVAAQFEDDTSWFCAKVMGVKGEELLLFFVDYSDRARCFILFRHPVW